MRAYEYLFESCSRSTLQKLCDMASHPNTEETVKQVALAKAHKLYHSMSVEEQDEHLALNDIFQFKAPVVKLSRISIPVNLDDDDLDLQFITGISILDIYSSICALRPAPSSIEFRRSGVIYMTVPPPYHGLTKPQYYDLIKQQVPGVRYISSSSLEDDGGNMLGYVFILHYI